MLILRKYIEEPIGWAGATLTLFAFGLNSVNAIGSQSVEYLSMNIIGSFCLILYALFKKANASWVLNTIWLLITAIALVKVYLVA